MEYRIYRKSKINKNKDNNIEPNRIPKIFYNWMY